MTETAETEEGAEFLDRLREETLNRPVVSVNGRVYDHPDAQVIASWAWWTAACQATGTACGENDRQVLNLCAYDGVCMDSRNDATRYFIEHNKGGQEGLAMYDALLPQFVDAIHHADIRILDGLKNTLSSASAP